MSISSKAKRRFEVSMASRAEAVEIINAIESGSGGTGPQGPAGPQGPVGPTGPQGPAGPAPVWGAVTGSISSQTDLALALAAKLTKGTKTILCIDNGDYATGQAAVDAASAGDTIIFGAKSGGWGNLVIPAGKKLSLMGLQAPRTPYVAVGTITYSPSSGTNITENELYVDSLFITSSSTTCVAFGGTNLGRIRLSNCYIYPTGTNKAIELTNTASSGGVTSSAYLHDCIILSTGTTATLLETSTPYVKLYRTSFDSGLLSLKVNAGSVESDSCAFTVNQASEVINIAGGSFLCGRTLITNTATNGSGVAIAATGVFSSNHNTFSVATGTGYCIRGTGYHLYGTQLINNSALSAGNVKIQSTVQSFAFTTAFTSSP